MAVPVCCVVDPCALWRVGVDLSVHRSQPEDRLVVGIFRDLSTNETLVSKACKSLVALCLFP